VAARVQSGGSAYGGVARRPEPAQPAGIRSLANAATREANVMAYNDVFMLIAVIAVLTMIWLSIRALWLMSTTKAVDPAPSVPPDGASHS
jgi:hypothetical protein